MAAMVSAQDSQFESLVKMSSRDGVENEKCVVAQHRTTVQQRDAFKALCAKHPSTNIPVEWVIDIADESSGWFYGTAYHFDDTTHMIHVMVPDKHNPTFDGHVLLDYRTVHLIECVDGASDALFNKIVRDSIIKIRWELKWFEEDAEGGHEEQVNGTQTNGRWVASVGRYYIRIANQLLVEDEEVGGEKGFVMITADVNVRLHHCSKGRGQEDFNRLVLENQVQSTPAALAEAQLPITATQEDEPVPATTTANTGNQRAVGTGPPANLGTGTAAARSRREQQQPRRSAADEDAPSNTTDSMGSQENVNEIAVGINRVWDMTKDLKECVSELLDEKDKEKDDMMNMAAAFSQFSLNGDLEAGLRLYVQSEEITFKREMLASQRGGHAEREAQANACSYETWHLVQRVEKGLAKLARATAPLASSTGLNGDQMVQSATQAAEMELVKRRERKLRQDLQTREMELSVLRAALPAGK
jgi:hypothetical protein